MIPKTDSPRGIVMQAPAPGEITHERFFPSPDLAFFIEHFWTVRWNLEGLPARKVETIPHPTIHLVFEKDATEIGGVSKRKFSRFLEGNGFVFSVKFRPGAFFCFYQKPISELTNTKIDPCIVFGNDFKFLEASVFKTNSNRERFDLIENFLRKNLPERDEKVEQLNQLLEQIRNDLSIIRVEQLPALCNENIRHLQRLFSRYLGVSPKWVIARYRIHELLQRLEKNTTIDWTGLAFEMGYSDQAHFIRDFKSIVGISPAKYIRQIKTLL